MSYVKIVPFTPDYHFGLKFDFTIVPVCIYFSVFRPAIYSLFIGHSFWYMLFQFFCFFLGSRVVYFLYMYINMFVSAYIYFSFSFFLLENVTFFLAV
jgi:hypothetical protein